MQFLYTFYKTYFYTNNTSLRKSKSTHTMRADVFLGENGKKLYNWACARKASVTRCAKTGDLIRAISVNYELEMVIEK